MNQGDIWLINLDPTIGAEIRKTRPAVIVNDDSLGRLPLKIIVPITDWKDRYSVAHWMVRITPDNQNNLTKISAADCFQVRSISEQRFVKSIGKVDDVIIEQIKNSLARVFSISF
ncbi:MAG: type II toxin-antitoxin system PemK/MazF family toxin [Bacteroidota bacterium]|jgi:mRNA interferase MazF